MARTRANASGWLRAGAVRIAVWPVWSGCSRRFQQAIVQLLGGSDSCSSHLGVSVPCQRYATHASNAARTNRYSSACAHPLLPGVAFAAFVGMLSIGSASQKAHLVSVLELCQLIPPRCCASLATPPEQQPRWRWEAGPNRGLLRGLEADYRADSRRCGNARRSC